MKKSVFMKYIVPFMEWYLLMIIATISIDFYLHKSNIVINSWATGISGSLLIIISFIYSFRKRKIIKIGSQKKLLNFHEYIAWLGSVVLLVHAGIHFNAVLPWLAVLALLINVASGLVGKYLLKKATDNLKEKKLNLSNLGLNTDEAEKKLFLDSITVDAMKKWRIIHFPITFLLLVLSIFHIITIIIFS